MISSSHNKNVGGVGCKSEGGLKEILISALASAEGALFVTLLDDVVGGEKELFNPETLTTIQILLFSLCKS